MNCGICDVKLDLSNTAYGKQLSTGEKICYQCLNKRIKFDVSLSLDQAKAIKEEVCAVCEAKLTALNTSIPAQHLKTGEKICHNCHIALGRRNISLTLEEAKQVRAEKLAADYRKENIIQEYKRTCNSCGKIWHVNVKEYERTGGLLDTIVTIGGTMSGNASAVQQAKRNLDAQRVRKSDMNKCPECSSGNFEQEIVEYLKK